MTATTRKTVSDLQEGDYTLSYGRLVSIKQGVVLWTLRFDTNALVRLLPSDTLALA